MFIQNLSLIIFCLFSIFLSSCVPEDIILEIDQADLERRLPIIQKGVAFNSNGITTCTDLLSLEEKNLCLIFNDSFERNNLLGNNAFNWQKIIMDSGHNGSNVDAKIENKVQLGNIFHGDKALLFNGRKGGSTHEIYLVSKPLDLSKFDQVYIQFWYLPIELENEITLSWSGEKLPEGVRVDICFENDYDCGLSGTNAHTRLRNKAPWDSYFPEILEFGNLNNLLEFKTSDWKLMQVLVDLDRYENRAANMVFKISVAMDEGYINNNRNKKMEDGLIIDEVIVVGVDTEILYQ